MPFTAIVKDDDVTSFRSPEEIRDAFLNAGLIFGTKAVFSCGSGVTACVLAVGLDILGKNLEASAIYDGSWSEYGSRDDLPKITST